MLLQMLLFHSFLWLSNSPLCVCTTSLSTSLLMHIQIASMSWLLYTCCNEYWGTCVFQVVFFSGQMPRSGIVQVILRTFFFFIFGCTCSLQKFLDQGLNPSHSCDLSCCGDISVSLTHRATRELLRICVYFSWENTFNLYFLLLHNEHKFSGLKQHILIITVSVDLKSRYYLTRSSSTSKSLTKLQSRCQLGLGFHLKA